MDKTEAYEMLKQYEDRVKHVSLLEGMLEDEVAEIMGAEMIAEVEAVKERYAVEISEKKKEMKGLEMSVKAYVVDSGERVKGSVKQVIYVKPRDIVDVRGLKGYAVANPDVRQFLSKSSPGTQIRNVGKY